MLLVLRSWKIQGFDPNLSFLAGIIICSSMKDELVLLLETGNRLEGSSFGAEGVEEELSLTVSSACFGAAGAGMGAAACCGVG